MYVYYICIYDPGLRFPTPHPPNVMTLSTLPIAPMTIWRPPCCFEGELAEIEYRITDKRARLEFGIPFHAVAKSLLHLT